MKVLKDMLNVV